MSSSCSDINNNNNNAMSYGRNMIQKIRCSHSKPGPTTDTSARVAMLRKVQARSIANAPVDNNGTMALRRAQRFGVQQEKNETHGVNGDASQHIYFRSIFTKLNTQ